MSTPPNQSITVIEDYVRYANRRPDQPIPAHWPDAARAAAMAAHPAGSRLRRELTAADGTPEEPLPTEHPTPRED